MYMRIAWVQTEPGQAARYQDEFRKVYFADSMRSVWLGQTNDNPDSLFIVTLWDSLDAIKEWESSSNYLENINPKLNAFILGNYSVSVCEIKSSRERGEQSKR
jgi:heme-degrading monooxygenase HmoA